MIPPDESYIFELHLRNQHFVQHSVLLIHQLMRLDGDFFQLFVGCQPVRRDRSGIHLRHLNNAGDAHFKEFVQIRTGYAQIIQSLQQR